MTQTSSTRTTRRSLLLPGLVMSVLALGGCAGTGGGSTSVRPKMAVAPSPDPRVGLKAGLYDAGEAAWNLRLLSSTKSPPRFEGVTNSDLAFSGQYAIQGNYNGYQVWDISDPTKPVLTTAHYCPASQNDVSVYRNLLFVSGEGLTGRLDCGGQGVSQAVSKDRLRGVRIFDITDIKNPKNVGNVQTCRGSHTHTVLEDPKDHANIYIYVSGSAGVRSAEELPGCVQSDPTKDPNSSLFRIEVIKVPLADPSKAAIVSSPRIFNDLVEPPRHGASPADVAEMEKARASGAFIADVFGEQMILPPQFVKPMLDSVVKARGGTGAPTKADSASFRAGLPALIAKMIGAPGGAAGGPRPGPTQCHDITVYPAIGLAGGACEGYGLLLDISDPIRPVRIGAVADSNFSYWHSATFNNAGTAVLFSDEWGGGGGPKCRAGDPKEWGANAIFRIVDRKMVFQSYYKLPAVQTSLENCVAHNGSLIPIPGRDVMVQAWYQGGISVFDWTDPAHPFEMAFFDRGPIDSTRAGNGGSWSVYWYNGVIVSSEIARGLDVFALTPSASLSQNELDAAKTVVFDHLNPQGQPKFRWPSTFALAGAYTDQLARSGGLSGKRITSVRQTLSNAERGDMDTRRTMLTALAAELRSEAAASSDGGKVRMLIGALLELAAR